MVYFIAILLASLTYAGYRDAAFIMFATGVVAGLIRIEEKLDKNKNYEF